MEPALPAPVELDSYPVALRSDAIELVSVAGKGRGLILKENVEAGESLLVEDPVLPCDDDMGVVVRHLIEQVIVPWTSIEKHAVGEQRLSQLLLLCPESLESLPKSDHFPSQRHRWKQPTHA